MASQTDQKLEQKHEYYPWDTLTDAFREGDDRQLKNKLKEFGVTPRQLASLGKREGEEIAQMLADQLLIRDLFRSPGEQVRNILEINSKVWKDPEITGDAIELIGPPPVLPRSLLFDRDRPDSGLYSLTLVYETGDPVETFFRNWAALCHSLKAVLGDEFVGQSFPSKYNSGRSCGDNFYFDTIERGLIELRKQALPCRKGFRWIVAELGRRDGIIYKRKDSLPEGIKNLGQELPMIAAAHTLWFIRTKPDHGDQQFPLIAAPDIEILDREKCERMMMCPWLYCCERYKKPPRHVLTLLTPSPCQPNEPRDYRFGTIVDESPKPEKNSQDV